MFQKSKLCASLMLAFSGGVALTSLPAVAQQAGETTERIEVTGSRIKRAESEGALPVTVVTREQLEASGAVTVAEFVRNSTFASAGNFRPQSGSSAQSFASVDLRGLGSARTLVLLDGRRLPKAPNVGDSVDMNSVPMAAVERIEILTDGASAIYGSDAIGGVINIITRKDFNGVQLMAGATRPENAGGDRDEMSALIGVSNDKGRIVAGVSHTKRGIVYTRERPWEYTRGSSIYGNNFYFPSLGGFAPVVEDCEAIGEGFYTAGSGLCSYDFNLVAADEAAVTNDSLFARGEYSVNDDWSVYMNASVSRVKSFGRYAPVPGLITLSADSPVNPTFGTPGAETVLVAHRFAAAGNRDNFTDNNVYNVGFGTRGVVAGFDIDVGGSYTESKYTERGRNYILSSAVDALANSGAYDIYDPYATSEDVLTQLRYTVGRDSLWRQKEVYGNVTKDLFKLGGGNATLLVGGEYRTETYQDLYDPQSEAGNVLGSSGNSAAGTRTVTSVLGEFYMPFAKNLDATLAARYEEYSDYGSDFSPKFSMRFSPMKELTLRASVGTGFRAPSLPILNAKDAFSAESVVDPASCAVFGSGDPILCRTIEQVQVDTTVTANPDLKSEKSRQFTLGAVWDATNWLSIKADYWNTKITDAISYISAQDIVDRDLGNSSLPIPEGLGLTRSPTTGAITDVITGYRNDGQLKVSGLDLNFLTNFNFGAWGKLRNDLSISHVLGWKQNDSELAGTQGLPETRATLANMWTYGAFEFNWNLNLIGENGSVRNVIDPDTGSPVLDEDGNPVIVDDRTGAYVTHDIQVSWDTPIKGGKLALGVVNVTGKMPRLVDYDGRNFNFYLYDAYGRQPYVRYTQSF